VSAGAQRGEIGKTAWLSQGFEELLASGNLDFDVIIVGSGYGGAIAAAELAGHRDQNDRRISVCVLERGREHLPGMFPSRLAEVPLHVRFSTETSLQPRGRRDGLFDIRIGPDVNAVLANGLGGGSLINAGVMEEPREAMLADWPHGVRKDLFQRYYRKAKDLLGGNGRISAHPKGSPMKLHAFQRLAPGRVREAAISIGLGGSADDDVVQIGECKRCGDCATGCNHDAKNSLDTSLLARAWKARARIFTGATVLRIERGEDAGSWQLHVAHTDDAMRKRQGAPAVLRTRKLILAAGTFGSTEILLRSQSDKLFFSPLLGRRFSSNGDSIAAIYNMDREVNALSDESLDPDHRGVGPTITGMLDLRGRWLRRDHVIQEIAVPGALRRAFEETVATANALHELARPDKSEHRSDGPAHDPCAVDGAAMRRTAAFVMMGDDGAGGRLTLVGGRRGDAGDGAIQVEWPELRDHPLFDSQVAALRRLARRAGRQARVLPNPLWKLLPDAMQFLADDRRGPLLTVHPLGGCPMGRDVSDGVVNHLGQVFDVSHPSGTEPLDGLFVLDGSIVRNALGINPALTIAALALRSIEELRAKWRLRPPALVRAPPVTRPRFRDVAPPSKTDGAEIVIMERMRGEARLRGRDGRDVPCVVELTLPFERQAIQGFVLPDLQPGQPPPPVPMARKLAARGGTLRVFRKARWDGWRRAGSVEADLERLAELEGDVSGTLELLHREPSEYKTRRCRALSAWWENRGRRDAWQALRWKDPGAAKGRRRLSLWKRISGALALASRAGEARRLDYDLHLDIVRASRGRTRLDLSAFVAGAPIRGFKRLTYERRANPWRQLMEMRLSDFPGWRAERPAVLSLDPKYLAEKGLPLFKIAAQNDQVSALADVASLLAYFLRLLLSIHIWSFRKPDTPRERRIERLPGALEGRLPQPEIDYVYLVGTPTAPPAMMRLTRYRPPNAKPVPVVMIHGYSASGTTFAHHAVRPNMAEYFTSRGREVWILDMRTSSGMPTATHPWAFEDAALADIPKAFEEICKRSGARTIDVFAHCMGAAMFTMAVLAPPDPAAPYAAQRGALPGRVRRAVLSQIAPAVVMSPANVFRGYAMRYLRHFLPLENYQFRMPPDAGLTDQLIDRLLATLPYPEEEFDIENPPLASRRTPFVGTRHRMDALYGRDFSLADRNGNPLLADTVLDYIDDLFGPLSIETVAQAINFARTGLITNQSGRNEYVLPMNMLRSWTFPTLSIHGEDNGLADVATLGRFRRMFKEEAGIDIEIKPFRGFGHQDCLIGKRAEEVFAEVFRFLDDRADAQTAL
jgi:choline dehydrogenase-like flavoprotein/alpha-beta hydrolase superfamily lysophospholipase